MAVDWRRYDRCDTCYVQAKERCVTAHRQHADTQFHRRYGEPTLPKAITKPHPGRPLLPISQPQVQTRPSGAGVMTIPKGTFFREQTPPTKLAGLPADTRRIGKGANLYLALADALRFAIRDGLFRQGEQLPTPRAIARCYSCSHDTVRAALAILIEQDIVRAVQGRGHFVRGIPNE